MKSKVMGLALIFAAFLPFDAHANKVADFYKGKTLRVIVASSAGGGYDAYSRVLAEHIVRFLPGNPKAVVQNMPGAGVYAQQIFYMSVRRKMAPILVMFRGLRHSMQLWGVPVQRSTLINLIGLAALITK